MKIYTKGGDEGETSLLGGLRVAKSDARIEAYGTVDELSSQLGVVRATWRGSPLDGLLQTIQEELFAVGALLASTEPRSQFPPPGDEAIERIENAIDRMEENLPPLSNFILPGGALASAHLHVARTVCRRAERLVVSLGSSRSDIAASVRYLNRLSDLLFVAAREANRLAGESDVPWKAS